MTKILAALGSIVVLIAASFGGFNFMDSRHAKADDLKEFKKEVEEARQEDQLDNQYHRLDTAEIALEGDPEDALKQRLVSAIKTDIERKLAKYERQSDE